LAHQDAPQLQVGENLEKLCTENWKAAADEAKKQTWGIFKETGIFACACRHGMILWIVDMVRSGELYITLRKEASSADFNVGLSIRSPS
jgi:hypothetical protein